MAAVNFTPIQLYHSLSANAVPTAPNLAQGELAININDGKLYYEDSTGVVQVIATKGAGTIGGSTTQIQYNNAGALAGNAAMVFNNSTNVTTLTTLNLTNALGATFGGTAQSTYTQGDILYSSAANTLAKLGIGTTNYILTSSGSIPQWVAPSSIAVLTATNLDGGAAGSVPYQSGVATTTFLAIGAANRVMTSTGTAPQWVTALTGLTGVSSSSITDTGLTSGRVTFASTSGLLVDSSSLTFNGTTLTTAGLSNSGFSTLVKTLTLGDTSFNGTAVFAPTTPAKLYMGTGTVTDVTSAISATNTTGAISSLDITPIAATNTGVTYTNASTLYIAGAPSAGTNITITNPFALYIAGGTSYLGGAVTLGGTVSGGGNQINNVVIGTSNPLAGSFTTGVINQASGSDASEVLSIRNNSGVGMILRPSYAAGTKLAWRVSANIADDNALDIGPSSVAGGSTFTTPVIRLSSTGLAVTGTLSATGNLTVTGNTSLFGANGRVRLLQDGSGDAIIGGAASTNATYFQTNGVTYVTLSITALALGVGISLTGGTSGTGYSFHGSAPATSLTLTSGGNVGVGTATPGSRLEVFGGSLATAGIGILAAGGLTAGRLVSDGVSATINPIHTYFDDRAYEISAGSTSGYVTGVVVAGRNFTGTGGEGVSLWTRNTERARIDSSGNWTVSTGNVVIGTAGKGIDFSADPSAAGMTSELLADYEEGTWTPVIFGTTSAGTGTYSAQEGTYTKVGRSVTVAGFVNITAHTGTGNMRIGGLPFTCSSAIAVATLSETGNLTLSANNIPQLQTISTSLNMVFIQTPVGGGLDSAVPMDVAFYTRFSCTYFV